MKNFWNILKNCISAYGGKNTTSPCFHHNSFQIRVSLHKMTFLKEERKHFRILSSEHFYYISIFPSLKSKAFFKAKAMGGVLVRMDKEALKDVKKKPFNVCHDKSGTTTPFYRGRNFEIGSVSRCEHGRHGRSRSSYYYWFRWRVLSFSLASTYFLRD